MQFTADNFLNYIFGTDNLNRFRNDFKTACNRNLDLDKSNLSKQELIEIIKERPGEAKRKHKKIRLIWAVFGGLLGIILGYYGYSFTSNVLKVAGILIALEIPWRLAIINATAYTTADENMGKEELVFRKAWNSIMFKTTSLAVLLLPALLLKIERLEAYELVMKNVENWYLKDKVL